MNRILITGALGQLGTVLARVLHMSGDHYVLATDIRNPNQKLPYDFAQVDVLDYAQMEHLVSLANFGIPCLRTSTIAFSISSKEVFILPLKTKYPYPLGVSPKIIL